MKFFFPKYIFPDVVPQRLKTLFQLIYLDIKMNFCENFNFLFPQ